MKKYLILITTVSIIISFSHSGCDRSRELQKVKNGGEVTIALHNARSEIFPFEITEFSMRQISDYLLSPSFISFDELGQAYPALAESWKLTKDGKSISYTLKSDIRWSDGNRLTTSDVKFSFDFLMNKIKKYRLKSRISPVREMIIIDDRSCRFEFTRPVVDPLYITNIPILPMVWKKFIDEPNKIENLYSTEFIGCGPFVLSSVNDESLILKKNKSNSEMVPFVDTVTIYFSKAIKNLSKPLHLEVGIPIEDVSRYKSDSLYQIMTYPLRGYSFIAWNLRNRLFQDVKMRTALTLGIDRETIVDGVLAGFGTVVDGPIYPGLIDVNMQVAQNRYDPQLAQQILDSLGWLDKGLGIRARQGKELKFTLKLNKEDEIRQKIALNIKKNLAAIGVIVEIKIQDWNEILRAIKRKTFDALLVTWVDGDRYDPSELFHSVGIKDGLNLTSYSNKLSDHYIEIGLNSMNPQERQNSWHLFQNQIAKDLPCTFLYNQNSIVAVNKSLKEISMDQRGYLVNIQEWWLSDR